MWARVACSGRINVISTVRPPPCTCRKELAALTFQSLRHGVRRRTSLKEQGCGSTASARASGPNPHNTILQCRQCVAPFTILLPMWIYLRKWPRALIFCTARCFMLRRHAKAAGVIDRTHPLVPGTHVPSPLRGKSGAAALAPPGQEPGDCIEAAQQWTCP